MAVFHHSSSYLLSDLHRRRVPELVTFRLTVLHGSTATVPAYLASDNLLWATGEGANSRPTVSVLLY